MWLRDKARREERQMPAEGPECVALGMQAVGLRYIARECRPKAVFRPPKAVFRRRRRSSLLGKAGRRPGMRRSGLQAAGLRCVARECRFEVLAEQSCTKGRSKNRQNYYAVGLGLYFWRFCVAENGQYFEQVSNIKTNDSTNVKRW